MQKAVKEIATAANEIAKIANVGGAEVAGLIISVLAVNPRLTEEFTRKGPSALLNHNLCWENGCLTWYGPDGRIRSPQPPATPR